jgi:hypothetical protein
MSALSRKLKQTCVYWSISDEPFTEYGLPVYESPVEVKCRWEDVAKEFIDAQGEKAISSAVICVASDMVCKGRIMLGTLEDVDSDGEPGDDALEIKQFAKTPNIKVTEYLREVYV